MDRAGLDERPAEESIKLVPPAFPAPAEHEHDRQRYALLGRLQLALLDDGSGAGKPFMGGPGAGVRVRPLPHLALDCAADAAFGRDALGAQRDELALSLGVTAFVNPQQDVQVYLPTGLFHAWARVDPEHGRRRSYRYFGAFLGIGAEYRFHPLVAISVELTGFIRGRTDGSASTEPEFVDLRTGETSNSSGGGLLRAGLLRYF